MTLLNFDLILLRTQATAVHQTTADVKLGLLEEFAEVFRDEHGVLKDIEATVTVHESATPWFIRHVRYHLHSRKQLQQQVQEGELMPLDSSDWATPIVMVHKKDGGSVFVVVSRFLLTLYWSLRHTPCLPQRRCLVDCPMVSPIQNLIWPGHTNK